VEMKRKRLEWKEEKKVKFINENTNEQPVTMIPQLESVDTGKPNNRDQDDEEEKVNSINEETKEQSVTMIPQMEPLDTGKPNNHDQEDKEGGEGVGGSLHVGVLHSLTRTASPVYKQIGDPPIGNEGGALGVGTGPTPPQTPPQKPPEPGVEDERIYEEIYREISREIYLDCAMAPCLCILVNLEKRILEMKNGEQIPSEVEEDLVVKKNEKEEAAQERETEVVEEGVEEVLKEEIKVEEQGDLDMGGGKIPNAPHPKTKYP